MAGLYLYFSCFEEAHDLAQKCETTEGELWHAILHRQEPDSGNAAYWFRKAGQHPCFLTLAQEAVKILKRIPEAEFRTGKWDPFSFIVFCDVLENSPAPPRRARPAKFSAPSGRFCSTTVRGSDEGAQHSSVDRPWGHRIPGLDILCVAQAATRGTVCHVVRESISSSITTNGRVEPIEWATSHAERAGPVEKILIQRGDRVAKDAILVELDSAEPRADLAAAEARIAQTKADLDMMNRGGHPEDLAAIQSGIDQQRHEMEIAQKDYDLLAPACSRRTPQLRMKFRKPPIESNARSFRSKPSIEEKPLWQWRPTVPRPRRGCTMPKPRRRSPRRPFGRAKYGAPIAGIVYDFDLKPGAYLNAGDVVASIGVLDQVRVKVYVDEPDLGQVAIGMPVAITWDAKRGQEWKGRVDKTPSEIVPLGSRQVGEVVCIIQNPGDKLLPAPTSPLRSVPPPRRMR